METLHTMADGFITLWNAPKDWSLSGGLIWLTGMCFIAVVVIALAAANENRGR